MAIDILVEHPEFIVINKPSGVPMHDSEHGINTLVRQQLNATELFLCHRLDTGTSGCLCIAKNKSAAAAISQQFALGQTDKTYLALSASKPKKKQGTLSGDMINRRRGQYILTRTSDNPAVTQFYSNAVTDGLRGFVVKPLTGKTHQIRVALKSLGSPILGDRRYGGAVADRLHLHAWFLRFEFNGQTVSARCLPDEGEYFTQPESRQWLAALPEAESIKWPNYKRPDRRINANEPAC